MCGLRFLHFIQQHRNRRRFRLFSRLALRNALRALLALDRVAQPPSLTAARQGERRLQILQLEIG